MKIEEWNVGKWKSLWSCLEVRRCIWGSWLAEGVRSWASKARHREVCVCGSAVHNGATLMWAVEKKREKKTSKRKRRKHWGRFIPAILCWGTNWVNRSKPGRRPVCRFKRCFVFWQQLPKIVDIIYWWVNIFGWVGDKITPESGMCFPIGRQRWINLIISKNW